MPWALLPSKTRQGKCIRALTLVGQRLPETVPQLKGTISELNKVINADGCYTQATASQNSREDSPMQDFRTYEPQHESVSPKKRKDRAISGVSSQVSSWNGFSHHRNVELKRRKLEQAENPNAHVDPTLQADLHRMAHHVGVSEPNTSTDDDAETKTVAEALRLLLDCIERGKSSDQHQQNFIRRLSVPIFDAMELTHDEVDITLSKQLSELSQATRKMGELNDKAEKLLQEKRTEATPVQQPTPPPSLDSDAWAELDAEILLEKKKLEASFVHTPRSSDTGSTSSDTTYSFPELRLLRQNADDRAIDLKQEQIQANYAEFEENAKCEAATDSRKDSVATGSTDTVGDMDFERIFLGDSDAEDSWHLSDISVGLEDVDGLSGLSGDMDGLEVEGYVDEVEDKDGRTLEERLGY
jgi:hypothetical protein